MRILLIGPTSLPWDTIAAEVGADLDRLARTEVVLTYRCTGTGPEAIRDHADAAAAAPGVVAAARRAAAEGFDGVIVDCTDDPGVDRADAELPIPVVGPGAALLAAAAGAPAPVVWLSGDELRSAAGADLAERCAPAATVILGGTGWSHLVDELRRDRPDLVVIDPLSAALDLCLERVRR